MSCDVALRHLSSSLLCAVVVGGGGSNGGRTRTHHGINDERQLLVILHRLVATLPTAMWHMDPVLVRSVVGGGEPHLASLLSVSICVCVVCEPWRMVVVHFVVCGVWCGVAMLLLLLPCAVVVGGVEQRSRVVVGGGGDRGDVGSRDDGGG